MRVRGLIRVLSTILAVIAFDWFAIQNCHAGTIQSIVANDMGKLTVGDLTFTFTKESVSVDPATLPIDSMFTPPTNASVEVTPIDGGVRFTFNPFLSLTTPDPITQKIFINYSVTATRGIGGARLAFTGLAVDTDTKSDVMETFAEVNDTLEVFQAKDGLGKVTQRTSQSVSFTTLPTTLTVTDTAILSTPLRGNGATSTAQLTDITNTFTFVPEPASIVTASTGFLSVLGAWYCRRRHNQNGGSPGLSR